MRHFRLTPFNLVFVTLLLNFSALSARAGGDFYRACPEGTPTFLGLVGGGARPIDFLDRFVVRSVSQGPQKKAKILIVAWASEEPVETGATISEELKKAAKRTGVKLEEILSLEPPSSSRELSLWHDALSEATGIWVTGGDQNRILDFLDTHFDERGLWLQSYCRGVPWGGTSAGTAIHSEWAMTGEADLSRVAPDAVELRRGTGFLRGVVVDQHFLKRGRMNRLWSALMAHPQFEGLGIDEGTAWLFEEESRVSVLGASQVFCATPSSLETNSYRSRFLPSGESFTRNSTTICW